MKGYSDWTMFMLSGGVTDNLVEVGLTQSAVASVLSQNHSAVNTSLATDIHDLDANHVPIHSHEFHCGHGDLVAPLGLLVQGILAFIAFASLIVKRFCEPEPERRPWKIWFFDTSKQAIGAAVIHFANVFLADLFHGDPCTWYIVSFLLDSTIGLLVIYVGLKITQCIVKMRGQDSLLFGEYGDPAQCNAWAGQCGLYILVMIIEKTLMTLLVLFDFWKKVRNFIMSPIKDPHLELIIVMFIVPFIVNAFIFWVVDNFLKKKKWKTVHTSINSNDSAMKYFKAVQKVKYYENTEHADESDESDILLSYDEESTMDSKFHCMEGNGSARSVQYSLLTPNLT